MSDARVVILVRNPAQAAAWRLELVTSGRLLATDIVTRVVTGVPSAPAVADEYHGLADWLERHTGATTLGECPQVPVLLTDLHVDFEGEQATWNVVAGGGWKKVLGLLILSFPEVHWRLAEPGDLLPKISADSHPLLPRDVHGADGDWIPRFLALQQEGFLPWFDPCGLRAQIRAKCLELPDELIPAEVVAMDDETDFAVFHAYVAYRQGRRAHVASTYRHMKRLLGRELPAHRSAFALVLEDRELSPRDEKPDDLWDANHPESRLRLLPGLKRRSGLPNRMWISYGNGLKGSASRDREDPPVILKPVAGMFDLWSQIKDLGQVAPGNALPRPPMAEREATHNAPGRLRTAAGRMVARAKALQKSSQSPMTSLLAALLAHDARLLLQDSPPGAVVDAIETKQASEALAECQFAGLSFNLNVEPRIAEIREQCDAVCDCYPAEERAQRSIGATLDIVRELTLVYRSYNQFDEELACLNASRDLRRQYWTESKCNEFRRHPSANPAERALYSTILVWLTRAAADLAWRYWNWLLSRWYHPFASLTVCILSMTVFLYRYGSVSAKVPVWGEPAALLDHVGHVSSYIGISFATFFSIQPIGVESAPSFATAVAMVLGYFHMGLIVAHLYQLTLRR